MKLRLAVFASFGFASLAAIVMLQTMLGQNTPRRIEVAATRFEFSPSEITLKKGEPVVLALKSTDVPHGLRVRELGLDVKAGKGQTSLVSLTPDRVGTFLAHCSVFCGSGHGSMTMTIHVTE